MLEQHTQRSIKEGISTRFTIGKTHNKQGSKDAHVRIVVHLTLSLIKSHTYSGAVLCVKTKIKKIIMS